MCMIRPLINNEAEAALSSLIGMTGKCMRPATYLNYVLPQVLKCVSGEIDIAEIKRSLMITEKGR